MLSSYFRTCVSKTVTEIKKTIETDGGIASFFHSSPKQTAELENISQTASSPLRRIPKWFEIRWSEFTYNLLYAILTYWKTLVMFAQQNDLPQAKGFGKFMTDVYNLRLMSFTSDVSFLLRNFQKRLQSDTITIVDIATEIDTFLKKLTSLLKKSLLGGWEEALVSTLDEENLTLKDIPLWKKESRVIKQNEFVSGRRSFDTIRNEIILSLKNFMSNRFDLSLTNDLICSMRKFTKFIAIDEDIRCVHEGICPDLDLSELGDQYETIKQKYHDAGKNCKEILKIISRCDELSTLSIVLSRICKPQSADCERLVSAYNILKSPQIVV